jgi:hypothetical protein
VGVKKTRSDIAEAPLRVYLGGMPRWIAIAYFPAAAVALVSYGWMFKLMFEAIGLWSAPVAACHIIVMSAFGYLWDSRQQR